MVIKVLVLRPHKSAVKFWQNLNLKWEQYGSEEVVIIIHHPGSHHLVRAPTEIKTKTLVNLRPDVIVLSDVAGCPHQFKEQEIETLVDYVTHTTNCHLLATYATFYHSERSGVFDNRKLCPLFGLDPETMFGVSPHLTENEDSRPVTYHLKDSSHLQTRLGNMYHSWGYPRAQVPEGGWESVIGDNLRVLAQGTENNEYVVLNYTAENYTSLYISHMPEYQTEESHSVNDYQFIYNALSFLSHQRVCSLRWLSAKVVAEKTNILPEEVPEDIGQLIKDCRQFAPDDPPLLLDCLFHPPDQTGGVSPLPDEGAGAPSPDERAPALSPDLPDEDYAI